MSIFDLLKMGMKNLWRRKLRTSLTLLSVAIGATSIVVMISLGIGMQENFKASLEQMGSLNIINVNKQYGGEGGEAAKLTDQTIDEISKMPNVTAATPLMYEYGLIMSGKYCVYTSFIGIRSEVAHEFDLDVATGTGLSPDNKNAVVMGFYMQQQYFDPKKRDYWMSMGSIEVDPFAEDNRLFYQYGGDLRKIKAKEGTEIEVVGMLKEYRNQQDYSVYMDITRLQEIKKEAEKKNKEQSGNGGIRGGSMVIGGGSSSGGRTSVPEYEQAWVKVKDLNKVAEVSQQLKDMGYSAYSLADMLNELNNMSRTIQMVLGAIGGVSLLIAAIGITNTMVMSTYERTREIGIMKVIGARIGDINRLFLFEAGFLGLVGGGVGLLLSTAISLLLNGTGMNLAGMIGFYGGDGAAKLSVIPFWLYLVALVFSTLIGVVAGIMPARRASIKISALEAIRNET